jgi:hypothetical protein
MAKSFRFLRAGPPPPKVALLPDALFFIRSVPVTKGATPAEAASQAELALEGVAPFPLAQLYYGSFWVPGAENALVFASYRRRFTSEQVASWEGAELVLPAFAAVLAAEVDPGTTLMLDSVEGVTAVHWKDSRVPTNVMFRPVELEAPEEQRTRVRDELLREIGGSKKVIDLESPLEADSSTNDREIIFHAGELESRLPAGPTSSIDVRDKAELAALRSARQRDILLWRVALGCAAALLLLVVGELALVGGRSWQSVRERQYKREKPLVDKIESMAELTTRIQDLVTKRLLPLEMVTQVIGENNERIPGDLQFTRVHAEKSSGLYSLFIEGKTDNQPQVTAYEATLKNLPSVQSAEAKFTGTRGTSATFSIQVTFKPGVLNPTSATVVSAR